MDAKSGDVFCAYNTYLKKYTACQVTKIEDDDEKKPKAVLLSLDWSDDCPLTEEQLPALKPLYKDFMYWNRGLHLLNVDIQVPLTYTLVGNINPLSNKSTNSYGYWGEGYDVYRQLQWQQIPQEQRDAFKAAEKSEEKITLAGKEVPVSRHRIDDDIPFEDAGELMALPCLSTLSCTRWHTGLYEYLQGYPFLSDLTLKNHAQSKLNFSSAHLRKLCIDMTGVEELRLNVALEELILFGELAEDCKILAHENGAALLLTACKTIPTGLGLDSLEKLHCTEVSQLDMEQVLAAYPHLRELRLWGKPGTLSNFAMLSRFTELRRFSTVDLFGFCGADIPKPEELPKLNWFWMSSLPEDAAKAAKQLYKKRKEQGLDLWIQKARKPEWLAQNLENPFRSWDGQENISAVNAKKAADLYKKTRSEILALEQCSPNEAMQLAETLVSVYAEGFNKMDKRTGFIETVERDDICIALTDLLELLPASLSTHKEHLLEIFERTRDF